MTSSPPASIRRARSSASGGSDSLWPASRASRGNPEAGAKPAFPPSLVVQLKALACELPHRLGLPLSQFSVEDSYELFHRGEPLTETVWEKLMLGLSTRKHGQAIREFTEAYGGTPPTANHPWKQRYDGRPEQSLAKHQIRGAAIGLAVANGTP